MAGFQNGEACHIIIHAEFFLVQHRILIPVTVYKDLLCGRIGSSLSDYKFPERIRIIRPDSERQGNNHFQTILLYRIAVFAVNKSDRLLSHPAPHFSEYTGRSHLLSQQSFGINLQSHVVSSRFHYLQEWTQRRFLWLLFLFP